MTERILTLHPGGKNGVNVDKQKYLVVRKAILEAPRAAGEMTFKTLTEDVRRELEGTFDGSISWYVTTVKLIWRRGGRSSVFRERSHSIFA